MKIIIIGCPGAGKSVLTRRINEFLCYPVMHLDKVYHTGGKSHITREELVRKVNDFANRYDKWIIDGNYISTLENRVQLSDTIIVLNISWEICLINAYNRAEEYIKQGRNRDDMAEGFDGTITEEFVSFIKNFPKDTMPKIQDILKNYNDKNVKIISNYKELEELIDFLKRQHNNIYL
ncbi:topology modulation protein [Clostridium lundense]|uniref:topology modulation protein n=1 Tax=Clostridium lundense TaxID=319475 RepID=UPI0004888393|nr:topology modulation protein [Clostridium lundense]